VEITPHKTTYEQKYIPLPGGGGWTTNPHCIPTGGVHEESLFDGGGPKHCWQKKNNYSIKCVKYTLSVCRVRIKAGKGDRSNRGWRQSIMLVAHILCWSSLTRHRCIDIKGRHRWIWLHKVCSSLLARHCCVDAKKGKFVELTKRGKHSGKKKIISLDPQCRRSQRGTIA
jgi:hypothetical protein